MNASFKNETLAFFETIAKYYGSKTEISSGITTQLDAVSQQSTWLLSEFTLIQSAYRNEGNKFMLEGKKTYFEISAIHLIGFEQKGRHQFEFIEQYAPNVYRITKIRFLYKY